MSKLTSQTTALAQSSTVTRSSSELSKYRATLSSHLTLLVRNRFLTDEQFMNAFSNLFRIWFEAEKKLNLDDKYSVRKYLTNHLHDVL
ncbi:MAG: hypothetical protein [Microviridae sp.]|nr:MAG: hypothetical protein [Microviridae sp.]